MSRGKKGLFAGLALFGLSTMFFLGSPADAQLVASNSTGGGDEVLPGPVTAVTAEVDLVAKSVTVSWALSESDFIRQTPAGSDFTSGGVFINVNDVAGYEVWRQADDADPVRLITLLSGATEYTDETPLTGPQYIYSVSAVDAAGNSSAAVAAEAVTLKQEVPSKKIKITLQATQELVDQILGDGTSKGKLMQDLKVLLANLMGVSPDRIVIIKLSAGSLIIDFEILSGEEGEPTPEELAATLSAQIEEDPAAFIAAVEDGTDFEPGDIAEGGVSLAEQVVSAPIDLGDILPDGTASQEITVTNEGTEVQTITVTVSGNGFAASETELVLQVGEDGVVEVSFDAAVVENMEGAYTGQLVLASDVPAVNTIHELTATVLPPAADIDLSGRDLKFAAVEVDSSKTIVLTISNKGGQPLTGTLTIDGDAVFTLSETFFTLAGGEALPVDIVFTPADTVAYSATIAVSSDDPATPELTVALSGLGVAAGTVAKLPGDFNFDDVVNFDDFFLFADQFGTTPASANWDPIYSLDADEDVDFDDFFIFADNFGKTAE